MSDNGKAFAAKREALDNQLCKVEWYADDYNICNLGQRTRKQLRDEIERRIKRKSDELDIITVNLWLIKDCDGCIKRTYKLTPIESDGR